MNDSLLRSSPFKCLFSGVIILGCFVTGVYLLVQGIIDPQSEEISKIDYAVDMWNSTYPLFSGLEVIILPVSTQETTLVVNKTDVWGDSIEDFPEYDSLFYSVYGPLASTNESLKYEFSEDQKSYKVFTNVTLRIYYNDSVFVSTVEDLVIHTREIVAVNSKVCRINALGYWDNEKQACYYHYNTETVCLVIDENFFLVDWYKTGCYNEGFITTVPITWTTSDPFTDFSYNILVEVRSENDPLVYASYNDLVNLSMTSEEYVVSGSCLISISFFVSIIPAVYLYRRRRRKYIHMLSENKGMNVI